MRKGEWLLSLVVIVAIGVALAGGFDRDAASQPAAQPAVASGGGCGCCGHGNVDTAAEGSCCGEKTEAVADSDESADPAACCPMAKQASLASEGSCGGCAGSVDAVMASSSSGCPYAKMVSAESGDCPEKACDTEGKCCSTDGKCCKKDASVAEAGCSKGSCPVKDGAVAATTVSEETIVAEESCCSTGGKCCKKDASVAEGGCSKGSCPVKDGAVAATTVSEETVVAEKSCCSTDGKCCKKDAEGSCCKSGEADTEKSAEPNEKQADAEAADAGLVQN